MKKISLILIIVTTTIFNCCTKTKVSQYLFLNGQQLQPLGIILSDQGLFYKNYNKNWKADLEKYPFLGFMSNESYLNTKHYSEADTLKAENKYDSILIKMDATKNDFYPLLIGNTKGQMSLDNYTVLNKKIKLLPVAICMSETKIPGRQDTMIVWFKPTESIKKCLPESTNIDVYLQIPKIAE